MTRGRKTEANEIDAEGDDGHDTPLIDLPTRKQTRHGHSYRHQREEKPAARYDTDLPCVHGHIGGGHTVGDGEQQQVEAGRNAFDKKETVERDGLALHLGFHGCPDKQGADEAERTRNDRSDEKHVETQPRIVHEEPHHRTDGHGDVIGETVVSQRLAAPRRGGDVDNQRIAGHGHGTERETVHDAQDDENGKRTGDDVAGENTRKDEIGEDIERLAGECIQQVTGKGTYRQCGKRIAGKSDAHRRASGMEDLRQVERENRHQKIESEIKQKIRCDDETVTRCDETFLCHDDAFSVLLQFLPCAPPSIEAENAAQN